MFLTASTTHIRRYRVPEGRLDLNFRHASPKGTPKTLAQYEVLGTMPTQRIASPGGTAKADSRAREGEAMDDFPEFRGTAIPGCAPLPPTWKPLECSSPRPTHIRRYNASQTASPPAVKRLPAIAEQSQWWKPLTSVRGAAPF